MSGISSQFEFGSCLDYGSRATVGVGYGPAEDGLRARYAPASGGLYYLFLWDPQGSVQQRHTDDSYTGGYAAYDRSTFEGYGALRQANKGSTGAIVGQHDPAGFGGQFGYYTDTETGLLCLTHRYYDPGTGKFINRDPIGYGGGANLYAFCDGNPVNGSDPDGTQEEEAKNGGNPWQSAEMQEMIELLRRADEIREREAKYGSIGRTLELQSYLRASRPFDFRNAPTFRYSWKYVANGRINPWLVRFTQDTVDWPFKNPKYNIGDTALALRNNTLTPEQLEPIRIFEKNGQLFSLDNRRVLTFRSAGKDPYFLLVDYNDPAIQKELYSRKNGRTPKFSTRDGGMSIIIKKVPH